MSREIENYCVSCERCYNCGRDKEVELIICDECGSICNEVYYLIDNKEYCHDCAFALIAKLHFSIDMFFDNLTNQQITEIEKVLEDYETIFQNT